MNEFKFDVNATVLMGNVYGLETDGQVVDRWEEDGDNWYAVVDLSDPEGREHEKPEDKLRVYQ